MRNTVTSVDNHGIQSVENQDTLGKLFFRSGSDRYEVEWDADAKVTPMGSLVFFAQYLQAGGLMDRLCEGTPLAYNSNNAPKERDVLGTIVLSILNGQTRYGHQEGAELGYNPKNPGRPSHCGAVERRGGLGHHTFGRFRQMVAGKDARSGRRGQSDIAQAHVMTTTKPFKELLKRA